jgi:hypothetical protein
MKLLMTQSKIDTRAYAKHPLSYVKKQRKASIQYHEKSDIFSTNIVSKYPLLRPLRTPTNSLRLLSSIISVLHLHLLHQLNVLFLRLIGGNALVNNLLPRSLLRLALFPQSTSVHILLQVFTQSSKSGSQCNHTLRSKVPGCSAFVISSPVATLNKPIYTASEHTPTIRR